MRLLSIDEMTNAIFSAQHLTLETILPAGQKLLLKETANLSAGGTACDVTDLVHPFNIFLAERISRLVHLDICGIDIVADDISIPLTKENGAVVEVNAGPGFRMHLDPTEGEARDVGMPVVDMLFPHNKPCRIPIIAVTGTNGKTTVVRLIAYMAEKAGRSVGFTTTDGIYLNHIKIVSGDCSGPHSAMRVLRDPIVDYAVLETARGGILRAGLGFDHCHISIVTNIAEDHLGLDGIHDLNELARVKGVVPRSTFKDGYAILNADDDLVFDMINDIDCHVALFSIEPNNKRIIEHCKSGGLAAYVDNQFLIVRDGDAIKKLIKLDEIPFTFDGTAICMIKNIFPVVLTGIINHFSINLIVEVLKTFHVTPEHMPGRMNIFDFNNFKVMVDYAHNSDAFLHLKNFLSKQSSSKKIGIIAATGDRRAEDIRKIGQFSAEIFDDIIIRHDKDGRGRTNQELTDLLMQGIQSTQKQINVSIISDEFKAIQYAIDHAIKDSFIFYFPDEVLNAVEYVRKKAEMSVGLTPIM